MLKEYSELFCSLWYTASLEPQQEGTWRHAIKIIAQSSGQQLARMAGLACRRWQALESTLQITTEFLADRAFVASQGRERFVVYFEFYTTWNKNAPWDMLAKSALLSQREKLPTQTIAIIFRPRAFRERNGEFRLEIAREPTQQLWFREVCLWKNLPESWWEHEPGLMAIYPLCKHGMTAVQALRHATTNPRLDVFGIIGRENMRKSTLYQEIVQEGEVKTRRAYLLKVLRGRFGEPFATEVSDIINSTEDSQQLEQLFDGVVLRGMDQAEFRAVLSSAGQIT